MQDASDERPYWRSITAHPAVVVLLVMAALAGGALFLRLRSVDYRATARLTVTPVVAGQQGLLGLPLIQESSDATLTIQTAANAVRTPQIADAAARELGPPWTAASVLGAVTITPQGQSNILEIQAAATSAPVAEAVADSYASSVIAVRNSNLDSALNVEIAQAQKQLPTLDPQSSATAVLQQQLVQLQVMRQSGDPTIGLLQLAELPTSSQGPHASLVLGLALLVGLVAGGAGAVITDRLGPRVLRTEADLLQAYPLPVLARAPLARRSRRASRGSHSKAGDRAAIRALRAEVDRLSAGRPKGEAVLNGDVASAAQRVVAITSPSRGDGRTTVSGMLAAELEASGCSAVVINLDAGRADRPGKRLPVPELIQTARTAAEYLIVDTPPLSESRDAALAASVSDVVVLVARLGHTTHADAVLSREVLQRFGQPADGAFVVAGGARWGRSATLAEVGSDRQASATRADEPSRAGASVR